jgi:transglutaminase-like putative cysteine protease
LTLRVEGPASQLGSITGGRQSFREGILRIEKESIPLSPPAATDGADGELLKPHLLPTYILQSDHPEIQKKAGDIVSAKDDPVTKARKLTDWVYRNIEKRPVLSIPNALETLRLKKGDCNEHAVLLAALARASGIPAQVEAGVVYQNRQFYYHAWNVLFLGQWITADATMGQLPADVTHVRLLRGTDQQIDLAGMIGRIKLEIIDDKRD